MSKVVIEFFHDVICSFCFPMSYRMRQLQVMMPEVQIVHRSFALAKSERDFDVMFGSRAAAKAEIMSHWEHANQNDDLHRFNIAGMRQTDFPFPSSMKVLTLAKRHTSPQAIPDIGMFLTLCKMPCSYKTATLRSWIS